MIRLKNGAEIATDFCHPIGGQLSFTAFGISFADLAALLSDPDAAGSITYITAGGTVKVFEGYTELIAISKEEDHLRVIIGRKGE